MKKIEKEMRTSFMNLRAGRPEPVVESAVESVFRCLCRRTKVSTGGKG